MSKRALYSRNVLLENELTESTVLIEDGQINTILPGLQAPEGYVFSDYQDLVIMSGLIDAHVHINEPGRTHWEGFETATRAAAAGGITTLVDMPLNSSPVTTTSSAFHEKIDATLGKLNVNCGFWGGYVGQDLIEFKELLESGILGIKVFLIHSGIDDFPEVTEKQLRAIFPILKEANLPILAHCELKLPHPGERLLENNPKNYMAYLSSRPKSWEDRAIEIMIRLCEEFGTRTHIVHLSSSNSITQIEHAKSKGLPISVETCPHYLYFHAEQIPDGSTLHKCAPPIRELENNMALWAAVKEGLIDFIVTDHSPAPPQMKSLEEGDFSKAWGGIAGLQFSLQTVWTKAKSLGMDVAQVHQLMSSNVAEFLKLDQKGRIAPGFDADLCIWAPFEQMTISSEITNHRHKQSPYTGEALFGNIKHTYVSGDLVYSNGKFSDRKHGNIILNSL